MSLVTLWTLTAHAQTFTLNAACAPHDETDVNTKTCEGWCNAEYADDHCHMCKCKSCSFCASSDDNADDGLPPSSPSTPPGAAELALSAEYAAAYESAFKAATSESCLFLY